MSKRKISIINLVAWLGGIILIGLALMEGGKPALFWNLPSVYMIIGGTAACLITTVPSERLKRFFPTMLAAFRKPDIDLRRDVETIVELAMEARTKGLISLEASAERYASDKFLYEGILHIADGTTHEDLRTCMEGFLYFSKKRRKQDIGMIELVGTVAPSLGLVGTYVGLIPMLTSLDDPTGLGPMMAIELVSSFYGGFIANILFMPLARRLKDLAAMEDVRNELVLNGLLAIQEGKNPRVIETELSFFADVKLESRKKDAKGKKVDFKSKKRSAA